MAPSISKSSFLNRPWALKAIRIFLRWWRNDEATVFSRLVSDPANTPSVAHVRGDSLRLAAAPLVLLNKRTVGQAVVGMISV
jgi:hypothetical protein